MRALTDTFMDHYLVVTGACINQWSYEPCHAGSPKMDRSYWRVRQNVILWKGNTLVLLPGEPHRQLLLLLLFGLQVTSESLQPLDSSMPGLRVPPCLSEFAQVHVHWIGDAHGQHEKAKRYDARRWTLQLERCPVCYWGRAEGDY